MLASECAFCNIVAGRQKAYIVFEDSESVAFLDVRPVFPGHVLLVPRAHHETMMELPTQLGAHLFSIAQLLGRAVERGMEADGVFMAINNRVSQSIPHVHIHLVPRRFKDGLRGFFWPRTKYADEAAIERTREAIAALTRERESSG